MKTTPKKSSPDWEEIQENLANQSGLAVVLVDEERPISSSNNNSICENLFFSKEFGEKCANYCGQAFKQANSEGKTISAKCHAGMHYQAVPLKSKENKSFVVIVGRTFLKSEEYRDASARAIEGDWRQFPPEDLFQNVLLTSSENEISKVSNSLENLSPDDLEGLGYAGGLSSQDAADRSHRTENAQTGDISRLIEDFQRNQTRLELATAKIGQDRIKEIEELTAWRSLFSSLLKMEYDEAFTAVADFLRQRYQVSNIAWLENRNNVLESVWGNGSFRDEKIQISISAADSRFLEVVKNETALELRERKVSDETAESAKNISLFPISIGGVIRSALVVGDEISGKNIKRQISRLIKQVASEIEILRLREEIKQQNYITHAVKKLNQTLKKIDSEEFWLVLVQNAAELMQAERGSILIFDESAEEFIVKAAVGNRSDSIKLESGKTLGQRVAKSVLRSGRPLIVRNVKKAGFGPSEWKYRTDSFISYPIVISGRKIGVLNLTDKTDGGFYDEKDLEILHTLAPQIALALDRTSLIRKAGVFEQLSITDPLTGLVNRRYLEERLTEEINRSQRHGYPISFMMIDVDSFKPYNDTFGHTEGDKALQLVGHCLKATLRGADVAARYGGEEFSILLPQTTIKEGLIIAERIRQKVENTQFPNRGVTVSIGIATCSNKVNTVAELISAADKALYEAKEKGRNNVQVYIEPRDGSR